jgi:hypothetical protein
MRNVGKRVACCGNEPSGGFQALLLEDLPETGTLCVQDPLEPTLGYPELAGYICE